MAKLSSEILGLSYQGDAGQVFRIICFRSYQRTAHDFRSSVFQLVKVGPIMLKSSEYDFLRLKVNSFATSTPCIMCVQYRGGGVLSTVGVFSTMGDIMSTVGGYLEYRGVFSIVGDIMTHMGGYHEYHGGIS